MADINLSAMSSGYPGEVERKLLELCDLEKNRIGRDIHDGVGQLLTGISLRSKALAHRLRECGCPDADELRKLTVMVDDVIRRIREVVAGMAPSEIQNQDAATALHQLCQQTEDIYHIRCVFSDTSPSLPVSSPDMVKHLYFIAAESIHNAIRHGEADQIEVRLGQGTGPDHGELIIRNNGGSFPEDFSGPCGIGLCGMKFRAQAMNGRLTVEQYPDHTVAVICSFDLRNY